MTNHGVQDKVIDYFVDHTVTEIDRVYWARRTEDLGKIYADRQQHLNPISLKQEYDLSKIEGAPSEDRRTGETDCIGHDPVGSEGAV